MLIGCECATLMLPGSYFGHRCEKEYGGKLVGAEVFAVSNIRNTHMHMFRNNNKEEELPSRVSIKIRKT